MCATPSTSASFARSGPRCGPGWKLDSRASPESNRAGPAGLARAPCCAVELLDAAKPWLKVLLALTMVGVGVLHFVRPKPFIRIVPAWLPNPRALVLISGFFEIAGGLGLLLPLTQRWA